MNLAFTDNVTDPNASRQGLINGQADLLQCFATVEGNEAVRQEQGSPFIREFCLLLKERLSLSSRSKQLRSELMNYINGFMNTVV